MQRSRKRGRHRIPEQPLINAEAAAMQSEGTLKDTTLHLSLQILNSRPQIFPSSYGPSFLLEQTPKRLFTFQHTQAAWHLERKHPQVPLLPLCRAISRFLDSSGFTLRLCLRPQRVRRFAGASPSECHSNRSPNLINRTAFPLLEEMSLESTLVVLVMKNATAILSTFGVKQASSTVCTPLANMSKCSPPCLASRSSPAVSADDRQNAKGLHCGP